MEGSLVERRVVKRKNPYKLRPRKPTYKEHIEESRTSETASTSIKGPAEDAAEVIKLTGKRSQDKAKLRAKKGCSSSRYGRWTAEEHARLLKALDLFGNTWSSVERYVGSRSRAQIRSHVQKHFLRVKKNAIEELARTDQLKNKVFIVTREFRNTTRYFLSLSGEQFIESGHNVPQAPSKPQVEEACAVKVHPDPLPEPDESAEQISETVTEPKHEAPRSDHGFECSREEESWAEGSSIIYNTEHFSRFRTIRLASEREATNLGHCPLEAVAEEIKADPEQPSVEIETLKMPKEAEVGEAYYRLDFPQTLGYPNEDPSNNLLIQS